MGGGDENAAGGAAEAEVFPDRVADIGGASEGQGGLRADGTPEGEPSGGYFQDFFEGHALGLDGIENIDTGIDQVGDKGEDEAAGVIEDEEIGFAGASGGDDAGEAGFEPGAPEVDAHEGGALHADIVPEHDDIDAGAGIGYDTADGEIGDAIEVNDGGFLAAHHVSHEVFHRADVPGGFPDGAGERSDGGEALLVEGADLVIELGLRVRGQGGEGIVPDFIQAGVAGEGMMHPGHVVAVGLVGVSDAEEIDIGVRGEGFARVEGSGRGIGRGEGDADTAMAELKMGGIVGMTEAFFESFDLGGAEIQVDGNGVEALSAQGSQEIGTG